MEDRIGKSQCRKRGWSRHTDGNGDAKLRPQQVFPFSVHLPEHPFDSLVQFRAAGFGNGLRKRPVVWLKIQPVSRERYHTGGKRRQQGGIGGHIVIFHADKSSDDHCLPLSKPENEIVDTGTQRIEEIGKL